MRREFITAGLAGLTLLAAALSAESENPERSSSFPSRDCAAWGRLAAQPLAQHRDRLRDEGARCASGETTAKESAFPVLEAGRAALVGASPETAADVAEIGADFFNRGALLQALVGMALRREAADQLPGFDRRGDDASALRDALRASPDFAGVPAREADLSWDLLGDALALGSPGDFVGIGMVWMEMRNFPVGFSVDPVGFCAISPPEGSSGRMLCGVVEEESKIQNMLQKEITGPPATPSRAGSAPPDYRRGDSVRSRRVPRRVYREAGSL